MKMNNLPELKNIIDEIKPEGNIEFFNEDESMEIYNTCISLMEEFIKENPKIITEPDFDEIFDENIYELMHSHFDNDIFYTDEAEEEMEDIIEKAKNDFFEDFIPPRSYKDSIILSEPDYDFINEQLLLLKSKPQPVQRTKEWYQFRHNLITASNAYKAFENQTTKNQLIYEKCQPLNPNLLIDDSCEIDVQLVNINTTLHWGQKYEPLSVKIYEECFDTKIEDFGCIQHDKYLFLGASPDGINTDIKSERYGRMLEIKNIVNREIDGIPKKEYWIQMQLQMEVCDLDECDFLETKFIEYPDYKSYQEDTSDEIYKDSDGIELNNICMSKDGKLKGEIIYFHTKEGKPFYSYIPLDCLHPDDIREWEEKTIDNYQNEPYNYVFMKIIYWKLEHVSCVLVCRNRQWFKDNIKELEEIWSIIEKERVTGFEHRAPNRKNKKENAFEIMTDKSSSCLLNFNKDTGKITIIKNQNQQDNTAIIDTTNLQIDIDL